DRHSVVINPRSNQALGPTSNCFPRQRRHVRLSRITRSLARGSMITDPLQKKAYDAVSSALPFEIDPGKISVQPGLSYVQSPIKTHDYATGLMAAGASVVERLGRMRGLPSQTMTMNRRLSGLRLNDMQLNFLNGYSTLMDNWGIGPDNGTYRTKEGRY